MCYPTDRYLGFTWVGWLNFLLLQWLCVRLQGLMSSDGVEWGVAFPVVPLTGWWTDYIPRKPRRWA